MLVIELIGYIFHIVAGGIQFVFANWIIQAMFAAWVAFALQQVHQRQTQRAERLSKRYDQKVEIVRTLFGLVDQRLHASRTCMYALQNAGDGWCQEREYYRECVRIWNEKAPSLVIIMLTMLPARYCYQFDREIFSRFADIERLLGRYRLQRETSCNARLPMQSNIQTLISEISEESGDLLTTFLNIARADQAIIDRIPEINLMNKDELSFSFLLSSLFKSRV